MHLMAERDDDAGGATTDDGTSDRGNAIIAAVGFGMLALLALGNVVGGIVVEHRAVEDSLTQTRLYWAAMGHASYLHSRIGAIGLCSGCDKPGRLTSHSSALLAEIEGLEVWRYPELGSIYRFHSRPTVMADPRAPSGKGGLLLQARFHTSGGTATGNLQALRTVPITRPIEMRFCVTDSNDDACSSGGDDSGARVTKIVTVHRPAVEPADP